MADTVTYKPSLPWTARKNDGDYGRDLSHVLDLTSDLAESTGRQLLAEALLRRLITDNGALLDDPDYGYNLFDFLNAEITPKTLSEMAARISAQFELDDRVQRGATRVEVSYTGGALIVTAVVRDGVGPFPFTLAISEVTATILRIG